MGDLTAILESCKVGKEFRRILLKSLGRSYNTKIMSVSERDPDRPIHKDYFLTKDSKNLNTVDRNVKPAKGFFEKPIGFDTSSGPGPSLAWQRYPETLKTLDNPDFKMNFGPKYMEEALEKPIGSYVSLRVPLLDPGVVFLFILMTYRNCLPLISCRKFEPNRIS